MYSVATSDQQVQKISRNSAENRAKTPQPKQPRPKDLAGTNLSQTARHVFAVLCDYANCNSEYWPAFVSEGARAIPDIYAAWPSVGTIADITGLSERAVQYALRQLTKAGAIGYIFKSEGGAPRKSQRTPGHTSVYSLTPNAVRRSTPDNGGVKSITRHDVHRSIPDNPASGDSITVHHMHRYIPDNGACGDTITVQMATNNGAPRAPELSIGIQEESASDARACKPLAFVPKNKEQNGAERKQSRTIGEGSVKSASCVSSAEGNVDDPEFVALENLVGKIDVPARSTILRLTKSHGVPLAEARYAFASRRGTRNRPGGLISFMRNWDAEAAGLEMPVCLICGDTGLAGQPRDPNVLLACDIPVLGLSPHEEVRKAQPAVCECAKGQEIAAERTRKEAEIQREALEMLAREEERENEARKRPAQANIPEYKIPTPEEIRNNRLYRLYSIREDLQRKRLRDECERGTPSKPVGRAEANILYACDVPLLA